MPNFPLRRTACVEPLREHREDRGDAILVLGPEGRQPARSRRPERDSALLHDGRRDKEVDCGRMLEAVELVVEEAARRGLEPVTVGELLDGSG